MKVFGLNVPGPYCCARVLAVSTALLWASSAGAVHVDPAPLPDDVVARIVGAATQPTDPQVQQLSSSLTAILQALDTLESSLNRSERHTTGEADKSVLRS